MIALLDAAAVVDLLLRTDSGERVRQYLTGQRDLSLVSVAHLDAEVLSAVARLARAGLVRADAVDSILERLGALPMQRLPITGDLVSAAWGLRDNVAARDALYVAAAQSMRAVLVTTDARLARAVPELAVELR